MRTEEENREHLNRLKPNKENRAMGRSFNFWLKDHGIDPNEWNEKEVTEGSKNEETRETN